MTTKAARALLGVAAVADAAGLRRAFHLAAKAAHPDRPGGDPERFRQVVEAYRLLRASPAPDRLAQPPAPATPSAAVLAVTPDIALAGGSVDHAAAPGRRLHVKVPPGLRTGDRLRAGGQLFTIAVRGEAGVMVRGDDLWLTVEVPAHILTEGGRAAVQTPLGPRKLWISRAAGAARLLKLDGQGLPARGRHRAGHLYLRLAPKAASAESSARALLRRFTAAWAA